MDTLSYSRVPSTARNGVKPAVHPLSTYRWITTHDLRFADVDANGHVNNGAYNSIIESNRSLLLNTNDIRECGPYKFLLAHFEIHYLAELTWPNLVHAGLGIARVGVSSIRFRQALFAQIQCVAIADLTIVAGDTETRKPRGISDDLRAVLAQWVMPLAAKSEMRRDN